MPDQTYSASQAEEPRRWPATGAPQTGALDGGPAAARARPAKADGPISPATALAFQRAAGNRAVSRLVARGAADRKSAPGATTPPAVQRDDDDLPVAAPVAEGPVAAGPAGKSSQAKARWGSLRDLTKKSGEFNVGTKPKASGSSKLTTTAGGAWLASQVNSKEKIGSVDDYMGSRDDPGSLQSEHLAAFKSGAHAFITPAIHRNIHNLPGAWADFKGWGTDANFVAPLDRADELVAAASAKDGKGIWELEEKLGIPKGSWVKSCAPDYNIFRYIIHDTARFNLRVPSGNERGAYASEWWDGKYQRGQWQPKGKTEGGAAEAVIDKISIDDLKLLGKETFEIVNETSLAENTRRYLPDGPPAAAE